MISNTRARIGISPFSIFRNAGKYFTIAGGKLHSELREVIVPPEKRVLNVAVLPSQDEYRPGAPAKLRLLWQNAGFKYSKFCPPVVADGKLLVPTFDGQVDVYELN